MIKGQAESICQTAKPFYYDFLADAYDEDAKPLVEHISHCKHCLSEVSRLEILLRTHEGGRIQDHPSRQADLIEILSLHLMGLGEPLSCHHIKPFLPLQSLAALGINVPTPVTAHLLHCSQCEQDRLTIEQLGLSEQQLYRLSLLFCQYRSSGTDACEALKKVANDIVRLNPDSVTPEILNHSCVCADCCDLIAKERSVIAGSAPDHALSQTPRCETIDTSVLFDCAVPLELESHAAPLRIEKSSPILHIRNCRYCFARLHTLYNRIYAMVKRSDSGVVTKYEWTESPEAPVVLNKQPAQGGPSERVAVTTTKPRSGKPPVRLRYAGRYVGRWAAAAAIILVTGLLLTNRSIGAVSLGQLYEMIQDIRNVQIVTKVGTQPEPLQEVWVSRPQGIYILKMKDRSIYWNWPERKVWRTYEANGQTQQATISEEELTQVQQNMEALIVELLPFPTLSEVPTDARWYEVEDRSDLQDHANNLQYELAWEEPTADPARSVYRKWTVYLEPETERPVRTELWHRNDPGEDYVLKMVRQIRYVNEEDIFETTSQLPR